MCFTHASPTALIDEAVQVKLVTFTSSYSSHMPVKASHPEFGKWYHWFRPRHICIIVSFCIHSKNVIGCSDENQNVLWVDIACNAHRAMSVHEEATVEKLCHDYDEHTMIALYILEYHFACIFWLLSTVATEIRKCFESISHAMHILRRRCMRPWWNWFVSSIVKRVPVSAFTTYLQSYNHTLIKCYAL